MLTYLVLGGLGFWRTHQKSGRSLSFLDLLEAGSIPGPNFFVPAVLDLAHHLLGQGIGDAVNEIQ